MESSGGRISKAQKQTGLDGNVYRKYLDITLNIAKEMVHGRDLSEWNWKRIRLQEQLGAVAKVNRELDQEGIKGVQERVIVVRLQTAIKDLKTKALIRISSETTPASTSMTEIDKPDETRPFDPIRDV